jgi:hypothetical protein
MDYFFYNTDADGIINNPKPRFKILIEKSFAATGGDPQRFGEQFRKLKVADILLMYENKIGVVAIGRVLELWDGKHYPEPFYYTHYEKQFLTGGPLEYRIKVKWFLNLSDEPVKLDYIQQLFGSKYTPRGAVKKIVKHRLVIEEMIGDLRDPHLKFPGAIDDVPPSPERVETKTYR